MKLKLLIVLATLYWSKILGQVPDNKCIIICESESKQPIPYASLYFTNEKIGAITDESGKICLEESISGVAQTIEISALSHNKTNYNIDNFKNVDTLFLKAKPIDLEQVTIKFNKKKATYKEIGYAKKRIFEVTHSLTPNSSKKISVFLPNNYPDTQQYYLHKIICNLSPKKSNIAIKYRLRLRIFNNDNILPSKDLLLENITIDVTPNDKVATFDIAQQYIKYPTSGIWVSVQCIGYIDKEGQYNSIKDFQYGKYKLKNTKKFKLEYLDAISPAFEFITRKGALSAESGWSDKWYYSTLEKDMAFCLGAELVR